MSENKEGQYLASCPFCGGESELREDNDRAGYGEYERRLTFHVVRCKNCAAQATRFEQKPLVDFTHHTVGDFRNNPALRAKVEDDYQVYVEQTKQMAMAAWNRRGCEVNKPKRDELRALCDADELTTPEIVDRVILEIIDGLKDSGRVEFADYLVEYINSIEKAVLVALHSNKDNLTALEAQAKEIERLRGLLQRMVDIGESPGCCPLDEDLHFEARALLAESE